MLSLALPFMANRPIMLLTTSTAVAINMTAGTNLLRPIVLLVAMLVSATFVLRCNEKRARGNAGNPGKTVLAV